MDWDHEGRIQKLEARVNRLEEARRRAHKHAPKTPRPQVVPDKRRKLRDRAERKDRRTE